MRPLLVVNPNSAGGRTGRVFPQMRRTIERALGAVDVAMTTRSGHAIDLAEQGCAEGRELIVAIGGDGTFSEIVNGRMRAGETAKIETRLGTITQGTGGDFRKALGLDHRLDRYLDALAVGHERAIDVGKFTYTDRHGKQQRRYFVNILSVGMGGLVDRFVAETPKHLGGKAAYLIASARGLAQCERARLKCTITQGDSTSERTLTTYVLAICNGQYFGGGMQVAPMAKVDSGRLEVVSLAGTSKLAFALGNLRLYDGSHMRDEGTQHFDCTKIRVELESRHADGIIALDVDGEPMQGLPVDVEIVPKAVMMRL
ncbi:MAG: diacylglycerol/lipid kinase family protein [Polyangiales bacterium]